MICLHRPDGDRIEQFLRQQSARPYSYEAVGSTRTNPPEGWRVDHTRVELGRGMVTFESARQHLEAWQQFRLGWVAAEPITTPVQPGSAVAVVAVRMGLWWVNACRIIYTVDEMSTLRRFGFAYGTLQDHVASGEERFLIEMDADETVWYDILAFSRPRHPLAYLGYPYVRRTQRRFGRESAARMQSLTVPASNPAAHRT